MHIKKLFSKRKLVLQCIYQTCSAEDSFNAPWQWDLNSVSAFLLQQKRKVRKEKELLKFLERMECTLYFKLTSKVFAYGHKFVFHYFIHFHKFLKCEWKTLKKR